MLLRDVVVEARGPEISGVHPAHLVVEGAGVIVAVSTIRRQRGARGQCGDLRVGLGYDRIDGSREGARARGQARIAAACDLEQVHLVKIPGRVLVGVESLSIGGVGDGAAVRAGGWITELLVVAEEEQLVFDDGTADVNEFNIVNSRTG